MVRAIYKAQRWVAAASGAAIADAQCGRSFRTCRPLAHPHRRLLGGILSQAFGDRIRSCLARGMRDRLLSSLVSGGFVHPGTPFAVAVDNSLAEAVITAG